MEEEKQQTFEDILEMQRVVAANRERIIEQLLTNRKDAVIDCETTLTRIAEKLKEFGYKKTRKAKTPAEDGAAPATKKRTRKAKA